MYVQTNETHTQLETLHNAKNEITTRLEDLEHELVNLKERVKNMKQQQKENLKQIEKHQMHHENMRVSCVECGYVEKILEDKQSS